MTNYKKGISIKKLLQQKFKFDEDGNSVFGDSQTSFHKLKGKVKIEHTASIHGDAVLEERIAGSLLGAPAIDGSTTEGQAILQELINNAATDYEGFMVYLTAPSPIAPFEQDDKFYFCENGDWSPSPFFKESETLTSTDADGDGIEDSQDPFITEVPSAGVTNTILNPVNFQNDPIFEQDQSGNILITAAAAGETNGNFEVDANGNIVLIA